MCIHATINMPIFFMTRISLWKSIGYNLAASGKPSAARIHVKEELETCGPNQHKKLKIIVSGFQHNAAFSRSILQQALPTFPNNHCLHNKVFFAIGESVGSVENQVKFS